MATSPVGPARAGFESHNALKDYSLAELRSPRSREPASAVSAKNQVRPVAQSTVTSPVKREVAGSNPATDASLCSSVVEHLTLSSTYSPAYKPSSNSG